MKNILNDKKKMISVTILTKDSSKHIARVLDSVSFCDEIIILDSGSADDTLEIARCYPKVSIYSSSFLGFGVMHNKASSLARNDWILSLDSDEVLSPELQEELKVLRMEPQKVYSFPFYNFFNGRIIKACGWYPDRHVRLYNKSVTAFTDDEVHEKIVDDNLQKVLLENHVHHYSYSSISDFLRKLQSYSDLFAEQKCGLKKATIWTALGHGLGAFLRCFIVQRGFLYLPEGLIISAYYAHMAFYKYLKLREANAANIDVS